MITLHYLKGACSLLPHIVLEWIDVPYELKPHNWEDLKSPEFLAINPMGMIPCLVDEDFAVSQNMAIIGYLDDLFPKHNILGGANARQKAEGRRWLAMMLSEVHPAFEAIIDGNRMVDSEEALEALKKSAAQRIRRIYALCDQQLADREYLTGFRSAADAYLYISTKWAERFGVDISDFKNILRFQELMAKDEGVVEALKTEVVV